MQLRRDPGPKFLGLGQQVVRRLGGRAFHLHGLIATAADTRFPSSHGLESPRTRFKAPGSQMNVSLRRPARTRLRDGQRGYGANGSLFTARVSAFLTRRNASRAAVSI